MAYKQPQPKVGPKSNYCDRGEAHLERQRAAAYNSMVELEDELFALEDRLARRGES